jgi:hypothetical protein
MMRKLFLLLFSLIMAISAQGAKYAGDPFSLGAGARALGMGGAAITGPFDASAGYWNPAGLNYLAGKNIIAMHAETFGSLLNHDFVGFCSRKGENSSAIQSYGFYLYYLGGGGIKITGFDPQSQRPYVIREESHGDLLLAGSLAGKIRKNIDFGVTGKIIYRDLGTLSGYGLTFDAGALYQLHRKILLGLMVTDITSGFIRYSGGETESILPTVKPGVLINHTYKDFTGRLAFSGDIKFEGIKYGAQFWMGEISLDTHIGMEVGYREMVFGRLGWDIGNLTAGLGVDVRRIKIDLAYLHNSSLDETFRVSGGYQF